MSLFSSRAASRPTSRSRLAADKENGGGASSALNASIVSTKSAFAGTTSRLRTQPVARAAGVGAAGKKASDSATTSAASARRPLASTAATTAANGAAASAAAPAPAKAAPPPTPNRGQPLQMSALAVRSASKLRAPAGPAGGACSVSANAAVAAFALPALADEIRAVFSSDIRAEYGADYQGVIARKIPKKNSSISYKVSKPGMRLALDASHAAPMINSAAG